MTERLSLILLKAKLYDLKNQYSESHLRMMNTPNEYDDTFLNEVKPIIDELEGDIYLIEMREATE